MLVLVLAGDGLIGVVGIRAQGLARCAVARVATAALTVRVGVGCT